MDCEHELLIGDCRCSKCGKPMCMWTNGKCAWPKPLKCEVDTDSFIDTFKKFGPPKTRQSQGSPGELRKLAEKLYDSGFDPIAELTEIQFREKSMGTGMYKQMIGMVREEFITFYETHYTKEEMEYLLKEKEHPIAAAISKKDSQRFIFLDGLMKKIMKWMVNEMLKDLSPDKRNEFWNTLGMGFNFPGFPDLS